MRSKIGKALRAKFDQRIKATLLGFAHDPGVRGLPGSRGYVSHSWQGFDAWIVLSPSPKDDCFYIDVASSTNRKYPDSTMTWDLADRPADGNLRFRLNRLYDPEQWRGWYLSKPISLDDDFFTFEEEPIEVAIERIDASLDDVFDKIKTYVLPYFEQLEAGLLSKES